MSSRISYLPTEPPMAAQPKIDVAAYEKKYPGKDGVYLSLDRIVEHVTMRSYVANVSEWIVYETTRRSYVLLNKHAEWLTTFSIEVNPGSEIETISLMIQAPDGTSKVFGRDDLVAQTNSDKKQIFKLIYPNAVKGSVITESFVIKRTSGIRDASNIDYALQFNIPCEKMTFKFMYPDSWKVQMKKLGPGRELAVTSATDDKANKAIVTYEGRDIPALEKEIYAPFPKEVSNYFRLMVTQGWGSPAFESWDEFARQFKQYAMDKSPLFSQRVDTTVGDLIKDAKTPLDQLEAIVEFVQENIEVGASAYKDNFADTLAKKKGNWYQVTGLAQNMLGKAGITSRYLLIHTANDGYFDKDFISFDEVYLPALGVSLGGREMIVLPYAKHMPVTHIPESMQGRPALEIRGDGKGTFTTTPYGSAESGTTEETYRVSLGLDGNLTVKEERTLTGSSAFQARRSLEDLKPDELEKALKKMLTYSEGNVAFKSHDFENLKDFRKPLKIKLEYTIDNLLTVTPEEVIFNTGGLFSPSSSLKTKVATEERQNPIRIYNDERTVKKISLEFPKAWSLVEVPKGFKTENGFGKAESVITVAGTGLQVEQSLSLLKSEAPREKFGELLDLVGRRSRLSLKTLVFKVAN
ncbi:MAG TPA: transglutaminase domain-containing protein [Geothrix sp.]|nr:transglutaminase domain-containing protein [Geothrix sp.]